MAHGFGAILGLGTREIFNRGLNTAGSAISGGLRTVGGTTRRIAGGLYDAAAESQNKIANPHLYESDNRFYKDKFGNKLPKSGMDSGGGRNLSPNSWLEQKTRIGAHELKTGIKGWAFGGVLSSGLYGLSAWATDDASMATSDRMYNATKHGIAATVDITADAGLTAVGIGLATFGGPIGMMAGMGIQAFNMFAGFAGIDAGSIAMKLMDYAEEEYQTAKNGGSKFNMTNNTSMAIQRQLSNIAMSGSNLGEMMHNAVDNRELYDCLQNNEFKKSENLCGTNFKKSRRKMAPTFEI